MIIKILGFLDIVVGLSFWLFGVFGIESLAGLILIFGLLLLVKGIIFVIGMDFISMVDIIFGIVVIVGSSVEMPILVIIVVSLFLIQKGVFSLMG